MKYILNNDNLEVVGKQYLNGVGNYTGDTTTASDLATVINDVPFEKGDAENSAVLKGGNNQVISEGGVALGSNNIVGLKGWYYSAIKSTSFVNQIRVYLSKTQKVLSLNDEPLLDSSAQIVPDETLPDLYSLLGYGATVSLVNDAKYDNAFTILSGGAGYVDLRSVAPEIPFSKIKAELVNDP